MSDAPTPRFFASPALLSAWLRRNHSSSQELWVGFHKVGSGRASITWAEAVDEALCFGWIDGIRKSLDADSYVIRFTPRKSGSIWSAVNIRRATELSRQGRMMPAGLTAFAARRDDRLARYSYEQRKTAALDAAQEKRFRAHARAWRFFENQPPSYRRTALFWIVSAKREETRATRLAILIADSAAGRKIAPLRRKGE